MPTPENPTTKEFIGNNPTKQQIFDVEFVELTEANLVYMTPERLAELVRKKLMDLLFRNGMVGG